MHPLAASSQDACMCAVLQRPLSPGRWQQVSVHLVRSAPDPRDQQGQPWPLCCLQEGRLPTAQPQLRQAAAQRDVRQPGGLGAQKEDAARTSLSGAAEAAGRPQGWALLSPAALAGPAWLTAGRTLGRQQVGCLGTGQRGAGLPVPVHSSTAHLRQAWVQGSRAPCCWAGAGTQDCELPGG